MWIFVSVVAGVIAAGASIGSFAATADDTALEGPAQPTTGRAWPGIAEAVAAASEIRPAGLVRPAAEFTVETGRLSIRFDRGAVIALEDGLGPVGFFVTGRGIARYASADPSERDVFPWNIQGMTRYSVRDGVVEMKVRRVLVLSSDGPGSFGLPDPPGMDEPPLPAIDPEVEAMIGECFEIAGWDFPILRAAARSAVRPGGGPGERIVFAALSGRSRIDYLDDGPAGLERLSVVRGETTGLKYEIASEQPSAGKPPSGPDWRLTDLSLDATFRESPALEIRAALKLTPRKAAGRVVLLSLDERRERLEVLADEPVGTVSVGRVARRRDPVVAVRSVRMAGVDAAAFVHRFDTLAVELAADPAPGRPVEMEVTLDTRLARLPAGHEYWSLREPGWFPLPRGQGGGFSLSWRLTSRAPYRPIVPGDVTRNVVTEEEHRVSTRLPYPVRNPLLVAGRFVRTDSGSGRVPIAVWTYVRAGRDAEAISRFCAGAIGFFSGLFGPYPFRRLDVVEAAQMTGGQSGPGIMLVAGMDPLDLALARRRLGTAAFNMTFAHEVAHQWWGQMVRSPGPSEDWLYEALSEYSAWLFVRDLKDDFRDRVPEDWRWRAKRSGHVAPLTGAHRIAGDGARRHRANIVYGKGALMLRAAAAEIGEPGMVKALAGFAAQYAGREAGYREFVEAVSRNAGRDLGPVFSAWAGATGLPGERSPDHRLPAATEPPGSPEKRKGNGSR